MLTVQESVGKNVMVVHNGEMTFGTLEVSQDVAGEIYTVSGVEFFLDDVKDIVTLTWKQRKDKWVPYIYL